MTSLGGCCPGSCDYCRNFCRDSNQGNYQPVQFFRVLYDAEQHHLVRPDAITAIAVLQGKRQSQLLLLARGCASAYMILMGAIYNTLLAGQEGGVALEWANSVVHVILPIYAVLD
ncbi:hypothetical protein [Galactobacter caseinivorans]|uniref:hypothetical protein n=1 Tax=Galactobacter caseinivorans TaxID=2676123 RepID=UPI0011C472A7|nr:hypothetical protein [Galactobacter caseinivorans]